ncbi:MAG: hypothetical protein ACRDZ3_17945 [Acidimicrobiia bacterium]
MVDARLLDCTPRERLTCAWLAYRQSPAFRDEFAFFQKAFSSGDLDAITGAAAWPCLGPPLGRSGRQPHPGAAGEVAWGSPACPGRSVELRPTCRALADLGLDQHARSPAVRPRASPIFTL